MTKEESLNRIKTSKYFFYKLNEIAIELNNKVKELENFIINNGPAGYKVDLSFKIISIQESKKNFSSEVLFRDFDNEVNNLKLQIEKLENQYNKNRNLIDKIQDFYCHYFLLSVFIYKLPKSNIKKIFKTKKLITNKDFDNFLNESLINFSYVLENEFKKKIPKSDPSIEKEIKTE